MPLLDRLHGLEIEHRALQPLLAVQLAIRATRCVAVLAFRHFFHQILPTLSLVGSHASQRQRKEGCKYSRQCFHTVQCIFENA